MKKDKKVDIIIIVMCCVICLFPQCRVIATREEQKQMLITCHTGRFYWKGITSDVKELVII